MATVAKRYQDELEDIKKDVRESYKYFHDARDYFNRTRRFVLESNLSEKDISNLEDLSRPPLQFNALEAYVSRLLGEFSKQEPAVEVFSQPTDNPPDPDMVENIEGHMRAIFQEFDRYEIYRDQMTGGYSAIKLVYEYENDNSFDHKILGKRVYDPMLCGWDCIARESHKGDGQYCYEFYPKTEEELKDMGYDVNYNQMISSSDDIKWCYKVGDKKVILLCDFYKKKRKRIKIYRLSDNSVRTEAEYKKILEYYEKNRVEQPPSIVQQRFSMQTTICRYRFIHNQVLQYDETSYPILPIIFVDGNSVLVRKDGENSDVEQIIRAYVHNAQDAQRLKNLSGQQLANSIQTMVEHKMKIALESIPKGYETAYFDVQYPGNYIFKAYKDGTDQQLPSPQEVVKMPLPPEVMNTFMGTDQLMQSILGNYDPQIGINKKDLSGRAIVEGATQSNAAAMPYIVNLLKSIQHFANGVLDLIPKLYVTPRSIPVITPENKRAFVLINTNNVPQDGKKFKNTKPIRISYNASDLRVSVKAGVNFEVQKQRALDTLLSLAQALPAFASIVNGKGLPILCDNLEIRGADRLKVIAEQQVEQMQAQQQKQQASNQPQFNPEVQKIALQQQKMMLDNQNKQAEIQLKQAQLQNERMKINTDYLSNNQDNAVQVEKMKTERAVHHADLSLRAHDQLHRHASDAIDHVKDIIDMGSASDDPQQNNN